MSPRLSRTLRRTAAVGLLGVVVGAVILVTVVPVLGYLQQLRAEIDEQRLVLGHLTSARQDEQEEQDIAKALQRSRESRLTIDGESNSIRMANLQSLVGGIATANGARLRTVRNLPARDRGEVRILGLQLQFTATIEQVQKIIVAIEAQTPYLLIDGLQITPLAGAFDPGSDVPGMLESRIDVFGATPRQKG